MVKFRSVFVILAVAAVTSEATLLGAFAGAATIPFLIGGKLIMLPKIVALKLMVGTIGLKIAGARYLREKVLLPASLAGAVAGYKATATVMNVPYKIAEAKTLAVEKLVHSLPTFPSLHAASAQPSHFQKTFTVPSLPVPRIQWQEKTVSVPKVVFNEAPSKTLTINKQVVPAYAPEEPEEHIPYRPY